MYIYVFLLTRFLASWLFKLVILIYMKILFLPYSMSPDWKFRFWSVCCTNSASRATTGVSKEAGGAGLTVWKKYCAIRTPACYQCQKFDFLTRGIEMSKATECHISA